MSAHQFLLADQLSDEELCTLIALRAYKIYEQRGNAEGDHLSDWLKAEAEILAAMGIPAKDEAQPKKKPLARAAAANGGVLIRRISVDGSLA